MITDKMLEENVLPWGMLSEDMRKAFMNTRSLEYYGLSGGWLGFSEGVIEKEMGMLTKNKIIRKKPTPLTKPDIPWEFIKEEYEWAAKDEEDNLFIFTVKPKLVTLGWWDLPEIVERCPYGEYRLLKGLAIDFGTCDWKDSLVERPK